MHTLEHIVQESEAGQRLDVWCAVKSPEYTRGAIQRAIKGESITVNGQVVKPKYAVKAGDAIVFAMPEEKAIPKADPESLSVPIIHEDSDVLVVDKPAGIATHPSAGISGATISDWFASRYPNTKVGEADRPGIVHRLDKDTSGILVLAKTAKAYDRLKEQFKRHRVRKEYLALVFGVPGEREGRIVRSIGRSPKNPQRRTVMDESKPFDEAQGKPAITEWKTERTFGNDYTLIRVFPLTGRTHQIRVHLHFLGFPIVGDQLYTFKKQRPPAGTKRQLLHAEKITLQLMDGKKKTFQIELPKDFAGVLEQLK